MPRKRERKRDVQHIPALSHEQLESIGSGGWNGQMQAIAANAPDDGRGVHVFVWNFVRQHFPQHHAKRPATTTQIPLHFSQLHGQVLAQDRTFRDVVTNYRIITGA